MGVPLLLAASTGFSFLSSMQQQGEIEDQVRNEQKEFARQQREANLQAQEEKSERARVADKQFASAITAMEALGGAGSQDEARIGAEIAGNAGLDISRIEGNRRRQVAALQGASKAATKEGKAAIRATQAQFLSTALKAGGAFAQHKTEMNIVKNKIAPGTTFLGKTKTGFLAGGV